MPLSLRKDSPRRCDGPCRRTTSDSSGSTRCARSRCSGGGAVADRAQHARGKLTARERLDLLLDPGSFVELDAFVTHRATRVRLDEQRVLGDGVVTGHGTIDGRLVFVFSQDFTVFGGSLSEAYAEKICKVMDLAMKVGAPIIGLNDSGGARIQEGVVVARWLRRHLPAQRPGVRRRAADLGDHGAVRRRRGLLAGDHRLHDHGRGHELHVRHRPERREGRDPRGRRLRSASAARATHTTTQRRRAPRRAATRPTALDAARRILGVPAAEQPRATRRASPTTDPADRRDAGARHDRPGRSVAAVRHARRHRRASSTTATSSRSSRAGRANIIVGFARLGGRSVGIVAQQPAVLAGALDIDASIKAARFVRTCDCFNVPLVTFVDVPGFLPGVAQEHGGIIRHGAKLLYAYCEATVPEADRHHPQGVRRRLRRHEQQAHPRRHEPRLADGRDRGDGRRGCGQHHLQGRDRRGRRPGGRAGAAGRASTRPSSPTRTSPRRAATSTTSSCRPRPARG